MPTVEGIERAIDERSEAEVVRLRDEFEKQDARLFAERIARDAVSGTLDAVANRALTEHAAGRTRTL